MNQKALQLSRKFREQYHQEYLAMGRAEHEDGD